MMNPIIQPFDPFGRRSGNRGAKLALSGFYGRAWFTSRWGAKELAGGSRRCDQNRSAIEYASPAVAPIIRIDLAPSPSAPRRTQSNPDADRRPAISKKFAVEMTRPLSPLPAFFCNDVV